MRSLFAALMLVIAVGSVGCHTCDVCDDCGDYGSYPAAGCTSCGSHAVVQPKAAAYPVSQTASAAKTTAR